MNSKEFVCGVDKLNGNDVWALYKSCATGNLAKAKALLKNEPRLGNAEVWYTFPIHFAVWDGNVEMVQHGLYRSVPSVVADELQRLRRAASWRDVGPRPGEFLWSKAIYQGLEDGREH